MWMSSYPATSGLGEHHMQVLRSRYSDSLLATLIQAVPPACQVREAAADAKGAISGWELL